MQITIFSSMPYQEGGWESEQRKRKRGLSPPGRVSALQRVLAEMVGSPSQFCIIMQTDREGGIERQREGEGGIERWREVTADQTL